MDDFTDIDDITRGPQTPGIDDITRNPAQQTAMPSSPSNETQRKVAAEAHDRFMEDKLRRIEANPNSVSKAERDSAFAWRDKREADASAAAVRQKAADDEAYARGMADREMKVKERDSESRSRAMDFQEALNEQDMELKKAQAEKYRAEAQAALDKDAQDRADAEAKQNEKAEQDGWFMNQLATAMMNSEGYRGGIAGGPNTAVAKLLNEHFGRDDIVGAKLIRENGTDLDGDGDVNGVYVACYRAKEGGGVEMITDGNTFFDGEAFSRAYNRKAGVPERTYQEIVAQTKADAERYKADKGAESREIVAQTKADAERYNADKGTESRENVAHIGADAKRRDTDVETMRMAAAELSKLNEAMLVADETERAELQKQREYWLGILNGAGGGNAPSVGDAPSLAGGDGSSANPPAASGNTVVGKSGHTWVAD